MALSPEFDKERGVGRTSTIFPRIEGSFSLDTPASKEAPKDISEAVKIVVDDINEQADVDPWDTSYLGFYIHKYDSIGPAKRMLQTQGEFSASFEKANGHHREESRSGNGHGLTKKDITIFYRAATRDEIVDKDAIQEEVIEPTVRRVVAPAIRAYESTLRTKAGLHGPEVKRVTRGVRARMEGIVFDAAAAPSRQRSGAFSELGRFVSTYLPADAINSALRNLKIDFAERGIPTPVRHEVFRSIAGR